MGLVNGLTAANNAGVPFFGPKSVWAMGTITTSDRILMTFFGRETSIGKIEIDTSGVHADSPEMRKRLDRIATNYEQLNQVLTALEVKIANDERLKAVKNQPAPVLSAEQTTTCSQPCPHQIPDNASVDPRKPR
jgi:hypothetical protein